MLGLSNSNAIMNLLQLHYFLSQNIGGDERYCVPLSKPKVRRELYSPSLPYTRSGP